MHPRSPWSDVLQIHARVSARIDALTQTPICFPLHFLLVAVVAAFFLELSDPSSFFLRMRSDSIRCLSHKPFCTGSKREEGKHHHEHRNASEKRDQGIQKEIGGGNRYANSSSS